MLTLLITWESRLTAYSPRTGQELVRYTEGGAFIGKSVNNGKSRPHIVAANGSLFLYNVNKMIALDISTGAKLWSYATVDSLIQFAVVDSKNKRVFFASGNKSQGWGRWDGVGAGAVTALNAVDGSLLWRTSEFVGMGGGERPYPNCSQLVYDTQTDKLYMFGAVAIIAAYYDPFLGCFNAGDGSLKWISHYQLRPEKYKKNVSYWSTQFLGMVTSGESNTLGFNFLVKDGIPRVGGHGYTPIDTSTGKPMPGVSSSINERCQAPSATQDYFLAGMMYMLPWSNPTQVSRTSITRNTCAGSAMPAYGGFYLQPGWCTCHAFLYGAISLTGSGWEPLAVPIAEDQRVVPVAMGAFASSGTPAYTASTSLVAKMWSNAFPYNNYSPGAQGVLVTPAVYSNGVRYSARINENLVEATDSSTGAVRWTFLAGGRVHQSPVLLENKLYFGSHDGYVYCLDAVSGSLQWRFFAAPNHDKIGYHGQVSSRWPVFGVGVHDGMITCAAGLHSEADGGIYTWALNPSDGKPVSRVRLYSPDRKDNRSYTGEKSALINNGFVANTLLREGFDRGSFREGYNPYRPAAKTYTIDFAAWNNQTIDPRTTQIVGTIGDKPAGRFLKDRVTDPIRLRGSSRKGYVLECSVPLRAVQVIDISGRTIMTVQRASGTIRLPRTVRGNYYVIRFTHGDKTGARTYFLP